LKNWARLRLEQDEGHGKEGATSIPAAEMASSCTLPRGQIEENRNHADFSTVRQLLKGFVRFAFDFFADLRYGFFL